MTVNGSKSLYIQVLAAVVAGALLGHFYPDVAKQFQPLGDAFVRLVRMVIAPIIFLTVVGGIAKLSDSVGVGRIGLKAIVYFEVLTTAAMLIGLAVGHFVGAGTGMNIDPAKLNTASVARYIDPKSHLGVIDFLINVIPAQIVDSFAKGDILPVLFFAILFGVALAGLGERVRPLVNILDQILAAMFSIVAIIMRVAPLGAFGAMAFAIGSFGVGTLGNLIFLMVGFYITCALFVLVVLTGVMAALGPQHVQAARLPEGRVLHRARHQFVRERDADVDREA